MSASPNVVTRVKYLVPMPSADVAKETTAPKMRFLYPLAAVCLAAVLLAPSNAEAQTPKLRPDQQKFIEMTLAEVDPAYRAAAYEQIAKSVAPMSEQMISMAMAKAKSNKADQAQQAKAEKAAKAAQLPERELTPEDKAFMRAQYEPLMRKHHAAQVEFDKLVNAKVEAYCPKSGVYARFGSGWRYEVGQFMMDSALGANKIDDRVNIAGEAYMPKDGRYQFDFSKVRTTFDKDAVEAAIKTACGKVHATGKAFLAKVDPLIAKQDWDGAFKVEGTSNAALEPIRSELQAAYDKLGPRDISEFQLAMMNGKRIS